jgi:ABC-type transport system involved in multi-copper enzyme maturation permease subunit
MPFWPVAAREARAAARAPRTYAWRAAVTAIGIASIPISLSTANAATSPGRAAFIGVSMLAFLYCVFGGILRTADTIAEEKRENTLGLLFLTDLKAGDVISGKLLASSATLFFGLLALMPLLAIPALLGGVPSRQLLFMILCLVNSLFFAISCGFLISTIFRQGWVTISAGLAAMLFYCVLIPLLSDRLDSLIPPDSIDVISPTNLFVNVVDIHPQQEIWQSFIVTHLLAWLHILFTAKLLPVLWQERPRGRRGQLWWERLRRLRFGGATTRKQFRTRLLNMNPLFWLSGREQVSSGGLMTLLMIIAALSLVSGWKEVFVGLVIMHAMLLIRMSSAASHALAEDRKTGALELLLATSLSVSDVLKGRWLALGRQFFGPILIVTIWHLFSVLWVRVMSDVYETTLPLMTALPALIMTWIATGAYGMWMGLRARHPVAAMWGTLGMVALLPWIAMTGIYSALSAFQMLPEVRYDSRMPFVTMGLFLWGIYLGALRAIIIRRVRAHFREAATDRYSDTQPIDWRPFWRVTWKIAAVSAFLIALIFLSRAYLNHRGHREFEAALTTHPTFSLTPPAPPYIADAQNLALWDFLKDDSSNPRQGGADPSRLGVWRTGDRYLLSERFGPGGEDQLVRLHAAAREYPFIYFRPLPVMPFPGNRGAPNRFANWNPQSIAARLAIRAEHRLRAGERPVNDVLLALRFANSLTNDVNAIASRTAMLWQVIQPVYDGVLDGAWHDSDLLEIQNAFAASGASPLLERARHHVAREVLAAYDDPLPGMVTVAGFTFWAGPRPRMRELPGKIASHKAEVIRLALDPPATWYRTEGSLRYRDKKNPYYDNLIRALYRTIGMNAFEASQAQVAVDLVVVACAIERYRLATGKLPAALADLAPQYLSSIPKDAVDGRPLNYKLTTSGYLLYSVAADGYDHGGVPERTQPTKGGYRQISGDWVWIYKK